MTSFTLYSGGGGEKNWRWRLLLTVAELEGMLADLDVKDEEAPDGRVPKGNDVRRQPPL